MTRASDKDITPRGNFAHLKKRPKNRADMGMDTAEVTDTVSPAPGVDDPEDENAIQDGAVSTVGKVGYAGSALGFGGSMASAREVTDGILKGKK